MNELWATKTDLCIDIFGPRSLTSHSLKGHTQLKIQPQVTCSQMAKFCPIWSHCSRGPVSVKKKKIVYCGHQALSTSWCVLRHFYSTQKIKFVIGQRMSGIVFNQGNIFVCHIFVTALSHFCHSFVTFLSHFCHIFITFL